MNSFSYDLHIHSCLSPCGDDDMTPANIAGMASVKGLSVIALTDHNTARNCPAAAAYAAAFGITFIPGMELTTSEEVHALCLFPVLERALAFDSYVHERIQPVTNRPEIFGHQIIMDEEDNPSGEEPLLLINATSISFDELTPLTSSFGGIMIPAHIDKSSNSLLSNLGSVPPDSRFTCAEISDPSKWEQLKKQNSYLESCRFICDSDAHYLADIHEPQYFLHAEANTPSAILHALDPVNFPSDDQHRVTE